MKKLLASYITAATLGIALTLASLAYAGPAEDFIRAKHTSLTAELKKPASPARQNSINHLLDGFFDFDRLAKDALGRHYDDISPAEFEELKGLVKELVTRNYRKNIEKTLNFDISFTGEEEINGGKERRIRTFATKRGSSDQPVEITYLLHKKGETWIVYDVETEGSSMLRNYRNQFGKTIRQDGFQTLLTKLRERVEKT